MKKTADILLCSNRIFTAAQGAHKPAPGIVAILGDEIAAVDSIEEKERWTGPDTKVYELGDQLVCPGFLDNHVFFTGFVWSHIGADLSGAGTLKQALGLLVEEAKKTPPGRAVLGHGLKAELTESCEDVREEWDALTGRPVIGFTQGRDGCILNREARERYDLDEDEIYAEACWKVFDEFLRDEAFIKEEYERFSDLLASRGVTAIKEIGFDQYSGFTRYLSDMEEEGTLTHRVNLVSQPVGAPMDLNYARECQERFQGPFVQFMGFNLMVDGEICSGNADLIGEYKNHPGSHGAQAVDYEALEQQVLEADRCGIRCALHAEGDMAVRRTVDIYEKCREVNGPRDARHTITDLELTHPEDLERMGRLGITATNYVQIMDCLGDYEDFYGYDCVGQEGVENYWAYKRMLRAGVNICCGTDLPLTIPDIPLSAYLTVGRRFPDGKPEQGINPACGLNVEELLRAWTIGGQYANFREKELGTLEEGKKADIAVLDRNLFHMPVEEMPEVKTVLTICNGKVVYEK